MAWRVRKPLKVFARSTSLRRRVAYSLALVRLILAPVILLAIYYLFAMGWSVDRIVNVDAPVATLAERAQIEMLDARRAERNFLLLHDPAELEANRQAISRLQDLTATARKLQPQEAATLDRISTLAAAYEKRTDQAVVRLRETQPSSNQRIRQVIRAYEKDLDELVRHSRSRSRAQLMEDVGNRLGSFDAEITATLAAEDPQLRQITLDLRASSGEILSLAADLEKRSWGRVERDHEVARARIRRAEWVLGIVSVLTLLLSVWVSFTLPRAVVKPLLDLKTALDHAAAGNYEIEFDVQGEGEVSQLAVSVRELIAHLREKTANSQQPPVS